MAELLNGVVARWQSCRVKDLDGWWGAKTEDPRDYMALPPEELAEKKAASLEDIRQHWRVENGELVNDGHGLYLTTRADFADFELLVDYKTVAKADSGIYLRGMYEAQVVDRDSRMQGLQGVGAIFGRIAPTTNAGLEGGKPRRRDAGYLGHLLD